MSISRRIYLSTALALSAAGSPVMADLTVDDAWETWQAQIKALGMTLSAEETRDGDALQVGSVTLSAELPMGAGSLVIGFAGPRFEPQGDGTVRMSLPRESEVTFGGDIDGEGSMVAVIDTVMEDNQAIMSGTPDLVVSDGSVGAVELTLASLTIDGEMLEDASGTMVMDGYTYQHTTTIGEMITVEGTNENPGFEASYTFEMTDQDSVTKISAGSFAKNTKASYAYTLPADGLNLMMLPKHLRDGVNAAVDVFSESYGDRQQVEMDGEVFSNQNTEAADYQFSGSLDETGVEADGSTGAFSLGMQVFGLPAPISLNGDHVEASLTLPLLSTGEPQDARVMMDFQDFTLNEEIWAMIDQGGALPRDPMALRFDLSGSVDVTTDLLDFEAISALDPSDTPLVPVSASLTGLLLSAVGAELTGNGDFVFDAKDTTTFPGMPRPEGAIDLQLVGGNALLDALVAIGLIPEDQAMGTRMMMGMFMVPGDGDDTLKSRIEINSKGHVLANGQRLR